MAKKIRERIITADEFRKFIILPNRAIDTTIYNLTGIDLLSDEKTILSLMQSKILYTVYTNLQDIIRHQVRGGSHEQLELWQNLLTDENYKVSIPIKGIAKANHYKEVIASFQQLSRTILEIPYYNNKQQKRRIYQGLFAKIDVPDTFKSNSIVDVYINKEIAKQLTYIEKNTENKPIFYSRIDVNAITKYRCKYSNIFYTELSKFKTVGCWEITYSALRKKLFIKENEFVVYAEFKRNVLRQVQDDLYSKADFWFDCNDSSFEIKEGRQVVAFKINLINDIIIKQNSQFENNCKSWLQREFAFSSNDIEKYEPMFLQYDSKLIQEKISFVLDYITKNRILLTSKTGYMKSILDKTFPIK